MSDSTQSWHFRQLVINPGSTSTKIAVYTDEEETFSETIRHSADELAAFQSVGSQLSFRMDLILKALSANGIAAESLSAVVARGGMLPPLEGGTYRIGPKMVDHLKEGRTGEHASNLGAVIAYEIAEQLGVPSLTADPVVVDELMDEARVTGIPEIRRLSILHALNQKAMARHAGREIGKRYEACRFIVAHLGGGISIGAHEGGRIVDTNNAYDGDGPFTPERAGSIPAGQLAALCFRGTHTHAQIKQMLTGKGGLVAHLGTNDGREIAELVESGDEHAVRVVKAMAYSIGCEIAKRAVALRGDLDAIVLTGSLCYFEQLMVWVREWIGFLGTVLVYPGEHEMLALSEAGLRYLRGEEEAKEWE